MDTEENYVGDMNDENEEEMYDDLQEEPKDLKSHSPKKRWKERHSGNNKDSGSYHRSPRRGSEDHGSRNYEDDGHNSKDYSRRSSSDSFDQHHRRKSEEFSDDEPHRKSSKRHDDEDRYLKSKQKKLKEKLRKIEAEDGEILEDGEIEDGEESTPKTQENFQDSKKLEREPAEKKDANFEYNEDSGGELDEEEEKYNNSEDNSRKRDKHDKRRKHRDHRDGREKKRKSRDDHHKKKKRRPDYVDHDKVNDDEMQQAWLGGSKKQSPKGARRQDSHGNHSHGTSSHGSHGKRDRDHNRDRDRRDRKNRYHSPGPYESPYDSPPGPYDSPSYDEDSNEEYQEEGFEDYKDKRKPKNKKSMMSLMQGDEYLDANVAVDEGENLYKKRDVSKKQKKQQNYNKRKFDRQHSEQPPKKKPLLETPMDERPVCRFYKEGKCHKGSDCPFNHEFTQKKPELCKYYLGGSCSKGDDCIFMHSEYPCKFYHTGQECYQGDNCKFSHDEPSEDTGAIVERMNSRDHQGEEEEYGRPSKPGVLDFGTGSPPRHLKEQMERIKKIPSLFDIQTFPPGQSPQKPMQQGGPMNNSPQQRMQVPNQGQPPRPVGFYNDTMQGGIRGPPPMGPQGPMNIGPQGMGQMGPPGPMQCPPMGGPQGQMQGPPMGGPQGQMNMPPNSVGQGPMNMCPPNSMGPMGGPMMQQGPMQAPMGQGQMGGPVPPQGQMGGPPISVGQGPPMMNPPGIMGPQGPMGGPPRMNNPTLNPALAIVGALLRHVSPQMAPHVSQALSVQGIQQGPRPGMGILSPNHPGIDANHDPRQGFKSPPQEFRSSQEEIYSPQDDDDNPHIKQEFSEREDSGKDMIAKNHEQDENEKKLASIGLDLGSLSQFPAKQRELMMRLQQHGGQSESEEDKITIKRERKESCSSEDNKPKSKVDDDNWYSSDEDDGSAPKLTDVLKNLNKKEGSSETPPTSTSSINVMQMINAIKSQSGPTPSGPQIRDPRQRSMDPRAVPHGSDHGHTGFPHPADPRTFTSGLTVPPINKWNSEPAIINSRPGDAEWRVIHVTIDMARKTDPPQGVNLLDPQFKNDPRIKKMLDHLNMKSHKENKNPDSDSDIKNTDPRSKPSALVQDPRLKKTTETSATHSDPRLQRTISDNSSSRAGDPRIRATATPPTGVHNLPVRPVDPRSAKSITKPNDPRLSRQMSQDSGTAMVIKVPKPSDPKLLPMSLGEIASPSPSDILASLQYPTDIDINEQKTEVMAMKKPNSFQDPRIKQNNENSGSEQNNDLSSLDNDSSQVSDGTKTKIDYRNDPRFKVKVKPAADPTQRRYGGQRKGSMEYSSPLDAESEHRDNTGYNSYNRPPINNPKPAIKQDPRIQRPDPRVQPETDSMTFPELPNFIPPEDENISTKRLFKQMDPTASPFC